MGCMTYFVFLKTKDPMGYPMATGAYYTEYYTIINVCPGLFLNEP